MKSDRLGDRLRRLGWTRREFAGRLGVHANTVSKWGEDIPEYADRFLSMVEDVALLAERHGLRIGR